MIKFGDVFKATDDFFKKTFSYGQNLELKANADNGVAFTAETKLEGKCTNTLRAEYKSGNFKVDKFQVSSTNKINAEFSLDKVAPDTKLTLKTEFGAKETQTTENAKIGAEVVKSNFSTTVEVDTINGPAVNLTSLFGIENFVVGASATVNTNAFDQKAKKGVDVSAFDAVLGYKSKNTTIAVQTGDKLANLDLAVYLKASDALVAVAKVETVTPFFAKAAEAKGEAKEGAAPAPAAKKGREGVAVALGASYKWDNSTTLYGAINNKGAVQLGYAQQISAAAKLGVYGLVDTTRLASDDGHKFGTKLTLTN